MTKEETKEILKKIDITYQTDFLKNQNYVSEWYKELKNYDYEDVYGRLEEHLRSNFSNSIPKLYFLTKGLKTPKEKENLSNLQEKCPFCKNLIKIEEFKEHYENCMDIDYIKRSAKKYLNQDIDLLKYYSMARSEVLEKVDQMMKVVYQKTNNEFEKKCIKKYFETKEQKIK